MTDMCCLLTRKERFGTDSGALKLEYGIITVQRGETRTENGFQLPSQYILKGLWTLRETPHERHMCTTAWTHPTGNSWEGVLKSAHQSCTEDFDICGECAKPHELNGNTGAAPCMSAPHQRQTPSSHTPLLGTDGPWMQPRGWVARPVCCHLRCNIDLLLQNSDEAHSQTKTLLHQWRWTSRGGHLKDIKQSMLNGENDKIGKRSFKS